MPVDIRATVSCSLGTVISGNVNDEYVQGTGLIKCSGTVVINAIITPAIGTAVTFSYTKAGVTRTIPRKLRVLSSFADPFRRTTSVELGCKLTYLSDKRDSIDWTAFDDDENTLTESDAEIITIPIRAQAVAARCLSELGISGSFTLTNKFSIAEFDLSSGYVQVLSDLLVSESLCGYLDVNEVLQVFSLDQAGGTGPVLDATQLVDIGKIGVGQLPGEAVTVSYSSLKLKRDVDQTGDGGGGGGGGSSESTAWTRSESSNNSGVVIQWLNNATGQPQSTLFNISETTVTVTDYGNIRTNDGQIQRLPVRRTTTLTTQTPAVMGSLFAAYYSNGISINSSTIQKVTVETFAYDGNGREVFSDKRERGGVAFLFGGASVPLVFSSTDFVSFNPGTFIDLGRETRSTIYVNRSSQVITRTYGHWFRTIQGQQAIAEGRLSFANASQVSDYINSLIEIGLLEINSTVDLQSSGVVVSAPTTADINNARNVKDGDPNNGYRTEGKAELELAVGSATAQRRIELSLPYAPDDTFIKTGGTYSSIESDAPQKAQLYGRVQNRLLLGNRNGMSIQVAPEILPGAPFSPFVIRSGSTSALYRTNGTSWTFDAQGLVASTDALFWGGVGGNAGESWFPVAPGITTLPTTPGTTTVNITDGSGNVIGSYEEMEVPGTVPVAQETALLQATLRLRPVVTGLNYALALEGDITATVKLQSVVTGVKSITPPTAAVTVAAIAPAVSTGARVSVPVGAVSLAGIAPALATGVTVAVPTGAVTLAGVAPDLVGRQRTQVLMPAAGLSVTGLAPLVAGGASVAVPAAGVTVAGVVPDTIGVPPPPNPLPSLSPVLWYDFADESTVTVSSSQITQITDKGTRGWTLTKSPTGPAYVTGINGLKCVDWGSAGHQNYLRNTSTTSTSIAEVYFVLDAGFGSTFPGNNGLISATGSGWLLGGDNAGGNGFWDYSNLPSWLFDSAFINGSTSNSYDAVLPTINSPVLLRVTRTAGAITATDGFCLGNDRSGFTTRGWSGLIGEVVVFSSVLSSTDRTAVQQWLAYKWGITL